MKNDKETDQKQETKEIVGENKHENVPKENSDQQTEKIETKSGRFQPAVDELAEIQHNLEYGMTLIRLNDRFDPSNVREEDRTIYKEYTTRIKKLELQKKKVIDKMLKQIKEDTRYKHLSDEDMELIRDHIDAGSTRNGFYFNDESIIKIFER